MQNIIVGNREFNIYAIQFQILACDLFPNHHMMAECGVANDVMLVNILLFMLTKSHSTLYANGSAHKDNDENDDGHSKHRCLQWFR